MSRQSSTRPRRSAGLRNPLAPKVLLKDQAYAELKELIQQGVFPPNSFLSERRLVQQLGMSKTPIRSALEQLEAQGLVAVSPQQGIVVRELSAHEITDLFDTRTAVEPFVVSRLASRGLTPEQTARVQENLREQQAAATAGDALVATRLDIEFHSLLAQFLDNREIMGWLARCFDKLHRSILRVNRLAAGRLLRSYQDHAAVAAAVLPTQGDAAAQRMVEHLRYGRQFLLGE
jgi:DNA-binding GntR family transcriptional regulator